MTRRLPRPCLDCGTPSLHTRCPSCEQAKQAQRNAKRTHYHGNYDRRAKQVRAHALLCWLCGQSARPGDPWQADHVDPGNPASELRPAHRSCNAHRGNRSH